MKVTLGRRWFFESEKALMYLKDKERSLVSMMMRERFKN